MPARNRERPKPAARGARAAAKRGASRRAKPAAGSGRTGADRDAVVARLRAMGSERVRVGMARFGLAEASERAFGVDVGSIRDLGKELRRGGGGPDHALANELWATGWHEARLLAAFVADPARVTPAEMNRWARDFADWAVCDTVCFHLWDRLPKRELAFKRVDAWAGRREEYVKRASFALLACLALHDKEAPDAMFVERLPLIETAAADDRNFVKKAVNWALRAIGKRGGDCADGAIETAARLAESDVACARWVGKDALRELSRRPATKR
ncbi:MAG TPA: DNA alkylation repair protein [Phycisphaerales bacterium]|nr:DNA alkylation repair protein [Phycisphaerales bacterium]